MPNSWHRAHPFRVLGFLACACLLSACGGGGGEGDDGELELAGPFVVDFETPQAPAADVTPESQPLSVSSNVSFESPTNLFIWSNTMGWGTTEMGCPATLLGEQGLGVDDDSTEQTLFVNFQSPVATVGLRIAAAVGSPITIQALDANGNVIDTASLAAPPCPGPMALVRVGLDATSNEIHRLRIDGDVPIIDDLDWTQWR